MTAYKINEIIKDILPWWDYEDGENIDAENIAHIQLLIDNGLNELYKAMINDLGVMAEHGDNENEILIELVTVDDATFNYYKEIFL